MSTSDAGKVSRWDPYDQNASAGWFDSGYMFDVTDGFDVVIGNPPYVQLQKDGGKLADLYGKAGFVTYTRTGDIYQLFYERGGQPAERLWDIYASSRPINGCALTAARPLRQFIENQNPVRLINLGADVFASVTVNTCVHR